MLVHLDPEFFKTYGSLFPATATVIAAVVAAVSARAALRSASAAQKAVETARASMEIGNRAYLSATAEFTRTVEAGIAPRIRLTLRNSGRSPALSGEIRSSLDFVREEFGSKVPQAERQPGDLTLAPEQQIKIEALLGEAITTQQMSALNDGTRFLYFWGEVIYKDVFGKERRTSWCLRFDKESPNQISLHAYHNSIT